MRGQGRDGGGTGTLGNHEEVPDSTCEEMGRAFSRRYSLGKKSGNSLLGQGNCLYKGVNPV